MASDRDIAKAGLAVGIGALLLGRGGNNNQVVLQNQNQLVPPDSQKVIFRVDMQNFNGGNNLAVAAGVSIGPDPWRKNYNIPAVQLLNVGAEITDQSISKIGLRMFLFNANQSPGDYLHFMCVHQQGPNGDYSAKPLLLTGPEIDFDNTSVNTIQLYDTGLQNPAFPIPIQSRISIFLTYSLAVARGLIGYAEVYYVN